MADQREAARPRAENRAVSFDDARSLVDLFLRRVALSPDADAFSYPQGDDFATLSWRQSAERVFAIAAGLRALGVAPGSCCAVLSNTRIEWILSDLGIMCAGGVTATVYPASTAEECAYILGDSGAVAAFVEDRAQLAKLESQRARLPQLRAVVLIDASSEAATPGGWEISLAGLEARGARYDCEHPGEVEKIARGLGPRDLATRIYTSGTTGTPKGVELVHDSWLGVADGIDALDILSSRDHQYLWLPLSHAFGKLLVAAQFRCGFSSTVDGRIPKLMDNLGRVRPTFMAAPPRIFEKLHGRVVLGAQEGGALRAGLFRWAMSVGRRVSALQQDRKELPPLLALQRAIADRLVYSRLRNRFGGRLRYFVSGSAPLSPEIAEFFHAMGLLILEGYGLTESGGASTVNRPEEFRFGTVGRVLKGVEFKLAEDGELLLRGRAIMRGYRNLPTETAQVLDPDGWLQTGDIASVDAIGRLSITDRKKDLIKTSGGKYIAPNKLESRLKSISPYISQVVVHGDRRNFCTALISLDADTIAGWQKEHGLEKLSYAQLTAQPDVLELVQHAVDDLNATLASYETIKRFALLPHDLTVENGELTPSMKVKRRIVEERNRVLLDSLYTDSATGA
jgi:long-chain acyl-CoA synthetase